MPNSAAARVRLPSQRASAAPIRVHSFSLSVPGERFVSAGGTTASATGTGTGTGKVEIGGIDGGALGEDHRTLENVFQLAHVAGKTTASTDERRVFPNLLVVVRSIHGTLN